MVSPPYQEIFSDSPFSSKFLSSSEFSLNTYSDTLQYQCYSDYTKLAQFYSGASTATAENFSDLPQEAVEHATYISQEILLQSNNSAYT